MIRWPCAFAAGTVLVAATDSGATPPVRSPAEHPPRLIAGFGLGPAFASCEACELPVGVGFRAFASVPVLTPLALGFTVEHERFDLWNGSEGGYTFLGPTLVLSNGFGRTWQVEVWGAAGRGVSAVDDMGFDGGLAFQAGLRLGREISPTIRLCLAASIATTVVGPPGGGSFTAGEEDSRSADYLDGARLFTLELELDLVPAPVRASAGIPLRTPARQPP